MITIPVYDMILLPGVSFYIKKDVLGNWNTEEPEPGAEVLFLLLKQQRETKEITPEDFYPLGFAAKVVEIDNEGLIQMKTEDRVNISDIEVEEGHISAAASVLPEVTDISKEELQQRYDRLRTECLQAVQKYQWGVWARNIILRWNSLNDMVCAASGYLDLSWEEKYQIMAEDSLRSRWRISCSFTSRARLRSSAWRTISSACVRAACSCSSAACCAPATMASAWAWASPALR